MPGVLAALAGGACVAALAPAAGASAASATIWTTAVTNLNDSGAGSLRTAIETADAAGPGASTTITITVPGVITLTSALPAISGVVTIDARSAPTHLAGGPPVVEINCNGHAGLWFSAGSAGSQLLGVAVDNASSNGVTLTAGSITLNNDYIGLDLAGTAAGNHGDGVYAAPTSSGNLIGLNTAGTSGAVANVISANGGAGLALSGSSGNTVVANRIGTNPAGTSALANGGDGLLLTGRSDDNEIGGTAYINSQSGAVNNPTGTKGTVPPVFVVPPLGNLISGNAQNGVLIDDGSRGNALNGNFIGTTANGDAAIGNALNGVWIDGANDNSLTGCKFVNNPFVYYNVISGNGLNGLRVTNSDDALVQGNFFGVGANNTTIVANRRDGILVDGSSADAQVGGVIPLGNVSAGNGRNGIEVTGTAHGFVTFNTFGGLLAFKGAAPNGNDGLLITSTGGDNLARTNVFSGNARNGIAISGNASGVTVDPDIVGLTTKGNAALPNGGNGLLINGNAHGNVIGGSLRSVIPQDTFSANRGYGIVITGHAHGNHVFSSFVGTALLGVKPFGNHAGGVLIGRTAYRNLLGQLSLPPANLISGNTGDGVTLQAGTHNNAVIANFIGLDRFGRWLRNSGTAIVNSGTANQIRGNRTRPRG
jgi:hypothetical protein